MPAFKIRKYICQYCVTAVCENCGWVHLNRPKVHFSNCVDCGAVWSTLTLYPSKHRADHQHLQPSFHTTGTLAPGERRTRGRPRKD
jgi:predicted  nucleic acid-binding Zn-ribbon protein